MRLVLYHRRRPRRFTGDRARQAGEQGRLGEEETRRDDVQEISALNRCAATRNSYSSPRIHPIVLWIRATMTSVEVRALMHQTPNLPGTSPVTDNPNPNNSEGMDTLGPSTDTGSGRSETGTTGRNPTATSPGREGAGAERSFRCSDVGNADCRWEAKGRTEDELMPQISDHARQAHGINRIDDQMRSKIKDAIRTRAA